MFLWSSYFPSWHPVWKKHTTIWNESLTVCRLLMSSVRFVSFNRLHTRLTQSRRHLITFLIWAECCQMMNFIKDPWWLNPDLLVYQCPTPQPLQLLVPYQPFPLNTRHQEKNKFLIVLKELALNWISPSNCSQLLSYHCITIL